MNIPCRYRPVAAILVIFAVLGSTGFARQGRSEAVSGPRDLRKTGKPGKTRDWALGPIGANGWGFSQKSKCGASRLARQLIITLVEKGTPADGKLQVGDVILGVNGKAFERDARKVLAAAISESEKSRGELRLLLWRGGKETEVVLTLPVLGACSKTSPFDCPKTARIVDNAVAHICRNKESLLQPKEKGWLIYINALGLLSTGREDVLPLVRDLAHASLLKKGETLSIEKHVPMMCWWWSYKTIFLCEYFLQTGDKAVLPTIEEHATKIAMGQSGAGTWGHTYAAIENTGHLHGHLGGYGAINQQGLTLMIALPLAVKCGIENKEIRNAIRRGRDFFQYFIGKGAIPYGDHGAQPWYDDNGKSGAGAIVFDLLGNAEGMHFFSQMMLASAPTGRETGHCGHYWAGLWGGIGASRGGDACLQAFMKEMDHIFTLERQHDGRFVFQGNVGEGGASGQRKTKWDCTGARLLQLCVPRKSLYITGKETSRKTSLTQTRIDQILKAGRLDIDKAARAQLSLDQLLELLQSPLPPTREMAAKTLAERNINCVDRLIHMLESDNPYARYGAAQGLRKAGFASKPAAAKLIALMQKTDDITLKSYAIDALIGRDASRGLLSVARPAIPVLLKMAVQSSPEDPRKVLQQKICQSLFYFGRVRPYVGLLHKYGLDGVSRDLLIPAIKELLTNQNGDTRHLMTWAFPRLKKDELDQLWPDIYRATRYIAPSGIGTAHSIRITGLKTMANHRIREGLQAAACYVRHQKTHGAAKRMPTVMETILQYGPHAKTVIPQLEAHAKWYAARRKTGTPLEQGEPLDLIQKTIRKIQALPKKTGIELESIADQIKDMQNP